MKIKLIDFGLKEKHYPCKFRLTGALIPESAVHLF